MPDDVEVRITINGQRETIVVGKHSLLSLIDENNQRTLGEVLRDLCPEEFVVRENLVDLPDYEETSLF